MAPRTCARRHRTPSISALLDAPHITDTALVPASVAHTRPCPIPASLLLRLSDAPHTPLPRILPARTCPRYRPRCHRYAHEHGAIRSSEEWSQNPATAPGQNGRWNRDARRNHGFAAAHSVQRRETRRGCPVSTVLSNIRCGAWRQKWLHACPGAQRGDGQAPKADAVQTRHNIRDSNARPAIRATYRGSRARGCA